MAKRSKNDYTRRQGKPDSRQKNYRKNTCLCNSNKTNIIHGGKITGYYDAQAAAFGGEWCGAEKAPKNRVKMAKVYTGQRIQHICLRAHTRSIKMRTPGYSESLP